MKIGILSDTHGWLDPKIYDYFEECDEIWHAGDIGSMDILQSFEQRKCVRAVYGNIDGPPIRTAYPGFMEFQCEKANVWLTHIAGTPPRYTPEIRTMLRQSIPDILICGHSHILRVKHDIANPPLLYINPGAAGSHGFHIMRTVLRFNINQKKITNMEVIELGKRGEVAFNN